jgi:hypothetical protein
MNSAAACSISRCSSVRFSGVITSPACVSSISHAPPFIITVLVAVLIALPRL